MDGIVTGTAKPDEILVNVGAATRAVVGVMGFCSRPAFAHLARLAQPVEAEAGEQLRIPNPRRRFWIGGSQSR
jgi:hypothetical protein